MKRTSLNNVSMNEALALLKDACKKDSRSNFIITCENCTLSILVDSPFYRETVEIGLFTKDGDNWMTLYYDGYTVDKPIINTLPLIAFPAFVKNFQNLKKEDFSEVWDAWDTISLYM